MNKKFSTLLAAFLAAGAFVGTVDAQSKITLPNAQTEASKALNGNVFYLSDQALGGTGNDVIKTYIKGQMDGSTTTETVADPDNDRVDLKDEAYYQWVAVKVSTDGTNDYYSFRNVATGKLYSGATAGTALSYKDVDLASYSGSAMSVFNIDTRALNADELNDMNQYAASFTMQFVDGADHKTPYTFVDNVFVGKKIVARHAKNAFFDYTVAAGEANATGADQAAALTPKEGTLLQVEGSWNGKEIYEAKHAYLETVAGTIVDVVYPVYNTDQLAAFRSSKFIILSNDQYSQFATDVDGENSIKGYKFTIVTGAELLGKLTSVKVNLANSKDYTYQSVETIYNEPTGWAFSTKTLTSPSATVNVYTNNAELKTSVVRPFDNAIFNLYAKGTTAKACVNDIVVEMPVVYKHGVDSNGDAYFQEYVWDNGGTVDKTIEASVFDFEGQKYVCAANEASAQTHPTFVTNAFVEGMLVQPQDFVAKKVVNVTYYAKQNEYGDWVNVDRNNDKVSRDASWTWGPADTKDVLKQFVDFTVPEGQWLINYNANTNTYAFVNMENQTVMPENIRLINGELKGHDGTANYEVANYSVANWVGFKLYDNGDDHYTATTSEYDNDLYLTITAAAEGDNLHGYTNFNDKQLENGFNIAVITDLMGNVYLKENHETSHKAAFDADKDNASVWRLQKYTAAKDYVKGIEVSDTIRVINPYSVWNAQKAIFEVKADTIEALAYAIKNDLTGEYLKFNANENAYYCDTKKYSDAEARTMAVDKFILKEKTINGKTGANLIPAWIGNKLNEKDYDKTPISASQWWSNKLIGAFSENKLAQDIQKYRIVDNDLFAVTPVDAPVYITMNPAMDTVKIFKQDNNSEVLYEKSHFLGMEHLSDVPEMKAAMFVDTAYVRNETARPQYLLVVGAKHWEDNTICEIPGHPSHYSDTTSGRFLVNMVDSMYALGSTHNNPYKWDSYPKLAFVNGIHSHDVLSLDTKDGVKNFDLSKNELNVATWAFRYVDRAAGSFIMEVGTHTGNGAIKTGYLKWLNGTPVVVNDIALAEVLNMKETSEAPTANENVAVSEVSVVAVNGAVVVKGAAGKKVAISNILGQALVNTMIASDSETIEVPAGIVVVAVEGEDAVKAVVK